MRTKKLILFNIAATLALAIAGISLTPFFCDGTSLCAPIVVILTLMTLGYLLILAMPKKKISAVVTAFVCLTLVCASQIVPLGLRVNDETNHAGLKNIMLAAKENGAAVASFMRGSPAAGFYFERKVPHLAGPPDLHAYYSECVDSRQPCWLISTVEVTSILTDSFPHTKLLAREGRWFLYSLDSASQRTPASMFGTVSSTCRTRTIFD